MNERLKGRVAIVTGAAKGLGQAYAVRLAEDGADIALGDIGDASETENLIKKIGRRSVKFKADVSSPDSVRQFAADSIGGLLPARGAFPGGGCHKG
jgi:NAD(P)-dependent dehydrogenase (short-subunit alcohol dehydrogenase family)